MNQNEHVIVWLHSLQSEAIERSCDFERAIVMETLSTPCSTEQHQNRPLVDEGLDTDHAKHIADDIVDQSPNHRL